MISLLLLSAVARWFYALTPSPEERDLNKQMADQLRKMADQEKNNSGLFILADPFGEWKKKEKGNDSDTLLIPYYDSLYQSYLQNTKPGQINFGLTTISERINELKWIAEKYRTEKLLPGTWNLVAGFDPKHPNKKTSKIKSITFFSDHTAYTCENGNIVSRDRFLLKSFEDYKLFQLEFYPQTKEFSRNDDRMQPSRFSGDTLIISDCQWKDVCKREYFLRERK